MIFFGSTMNFSPKWGAIMTTKTYYKVKKDSAFYREKGSRKNDPFYVFENELFMGAELEKLRKRNYTIPMRLLEIVYHRPCDTVKIFGARWYKENIGV